MRRAALIGPVALAVVAVVALVYVRQKTVVVVHYDTPVARSEGEVGASTGFDASSGTGEALIVPSAEGTFARVGFAFGRGYGSLTGDSRAPFTRLTVPAGSIVWACAGRAVGSDACAPGMHFRTEAAAVISPKASDCEFFACNAGSNCVPAVALQPGELGNVGYVQKFRSSAKANDGLGVFVGGACDAGTNARGEGPATIEARRAATKQLAPARAVGTAQFRVARVEEMVDSLPSLTYPPQRVRVTVRQQVGSVARAQVRGAAIAQLNEQLGPNFRLDPDSLKLSLEDNGNLGAHFRASGRGSPR